MAWADTGEVDEERNPWRDASSDSDCSSVSLPVVKRPRGRPKKAASSCTALVPYVNPLAQAAKRHLVLAGFLRPVGSSFCKELVKLVITPCPVVKTWTTDLLHIILGPVAQKITSSASQAFHLGTCRMRLSERRMASACSVYLAARSFWSAVVSNFYMMVQAGQLRPVAAFVYCLFDETRFPFCAVASQFGETNVVLMAMVPVYSLTIGLPPEVQLAHFDSHEISRAPRSLFSLAVNWRNFPNAPLNLLTQTAQSTNRDGAQQSRTNMAVLAT
jgi:hypothetical protein